MSQAAQLQISQPYFADTSTPLAASATFTGAARDMGASNAEFRSFSATFFASHASATNGAKIQMSNDGIAWVDAAVATLAANVPQSLSVPVVARYYRTQLINDATLQTAVAVNSAASRT